MPSAPPSARRGLDGALALAVTAAALAASGCGSSSSTGAGGDPASLVPASAPLYVTATVRPSGSLHDDTTSFARKLTHLQDPFGRLVSSLQRSSKPRFDYQRDIEPWLGGRVALFVTRFASSTSGGGSPVSASGLLARGLSAGSSFGSGATEGAIVAATTDAAKARTFLQKDAGADARQASYRGVSYEIRGDRTAEGVVDGFAVAGSPGAFKSVVDTSRGGPALTASPEFRSLNESSGDALAQGFVNFNALLSSAGGSKSSGALSIFRQLLASAHLTVADIALTVPTPDSAAIEVRTPHSSPASAGPSGADVLAGLPGDSWFALGIGNLGGTLRGATKTLSSVGSLGGVSLGPMFSGLGAKSGLDVQRDLLSWMGGTGIFVRGGSLLDLGLGVVIQSKDPARSRAAVGKLAAALKRSGESVRPLALAGADAGVAVRGKSSPLTFDIVDGQGKFVIGLGQSAVSAALHPATTLAGAPSYAAAQAALGGGIRPSLMLDFPSLLTFVQGIGGGSSAGLAKAKPYLQSLGTLAAGGQSAGSLHRSRLVLTVH